jgi:hypothetical protein
MPNSFQGGCACGAVRYECAAPPMASFNCHCRDCQRFTGSAFSSEILMSSAAFTLTRGEPKYYTVAADNGAETSRGFCAACGSPVVVRLSSMPDAVAVPAASFDDPSWHEPTMDFFTSSAQPWDYMNPALAKFPRGPEGAN